MRTLLLMFLFIAVPLAGGSLKPELEIEFWKNSGANLHLAKSVINDADCASTEQYFNSCRKALLVGADLQKLDQLPEFKALADSPYVRDFKFERGLEKILEKRGGPMIEWLVGSMLNAQIKFFDPYAQLSPKLYSQYLMNGDNKTYYGSGIEGEANAAGLFVFRIFPASPASAADVQVHDRIVSINGELLNSLSKAHAAVPKLNGVMGEKLVLVTERDGQRREVILQVAPVVIPENPSVEYLLNDQRFLQVRLRNFRHGACSFLEKRIAAAQAVSEVPVAGVILDLRHNQGGLVDESECVVRLFTAQKNVVSRQRMAITFPKSLDFAPLRWPDNSQARPGAAPFADMPLVVLINAKSASASEIAAGALQDFGRAWVVGERSFGKGTTQLVHELKDFPNLTIKKTVSRYLRPSGLSVHRNGVTPNIAVGGWINAKAAERRYVREENVVSVLQLPAEGVWQENRPQQIAAVQVCLRNEEKVSRSEAAIQSRLGFSDHQAAIALAVFGCP